MKSDKGKCIVVSSKSNLNSLKKHQMRWTIENMFGAFKTRGFNFEDTQNYCRILSEDIWYKINVESKEIF